MDRALIKGKRGLTQLGGPDELACDFERRGLRDDAGPGFPAPTIPRLFSALARKPMVCGVYSAGTTGLGRRTRK